MFQRHIELLGSTQQFNYQGYRRSLSAANSFGCVGGGLSEAASPAREC